MRVLSLVVLGGLTFLAGCSTSDSADKEGATANDLAPNTDEVTLDPETEQRVEKLFYRAADAYNAARFDEAIDLWSQTIALDSQNPVAFHNRGTCYEEIAKWDEAIADYDEAIRMDPVYVRAYNSRGNAYAGKGDAESARENYRKVLALDREHADAHYNLGNLTDDHGEAIGHYTEAIRNNPMYARAYHNRGARYLIRSEAQQAIADFTKAIEIEPNYAMAFFNRAVAYDELGEVQKTRDDLKTARAIDPSIGR